MRELKGDGRKENGREERNERMGHEREKKGERAIGRHERETRDSRLETRGEARGNGAQTRDRGCQGARGGRGEGEEETKPRVGGR